MTTSLYCCTNEEIYVYEEIYVNDYTTLYCCRSKTLKLCFRNQFVGGDVGCELCGTAEEHFLWECRGLGEVREMNAVTSKSP